MAQGNFLKEEFTENSKLSGIFLHKYSQNCIYSSVKFSAVGYE